MDRTKTLTLAIAVSGGITKLAEVLDVSPQAVSKWAYIPLARAPQIERATEGRVTVEQIAADYREVVQQRKAAQ